MADHEVLSPTTLLKLIERRALRELWVRDGRTQVWRELGDAILAARAACQTAGVRAGDIVLTPGEATFGALAWFFAVALEGAVVAPLRVEREGEIDTWRRHAAPRWRVRDNRLEALPAEQRSGSAEQLLAQLREQGRPGLILATGGTTGTPKLVLHDLAALLATVPVKQSAARRIMPLMRFDHIGGLDMAWRALGSGHVLVEPPAELTPENVAAAVEKHRVEVMPATPSFLNLLLAAEAHRRHSLGSLAIVPYGAEPMPVGLLARLRSALPKVEFVQRFGTSETGAVPVTESGAGLVLGDDTAGFRWKIVDGELWVRSPAQALGYLGGEAGGLGRDGWFRTGDLAERMPDGAVRVLGRREELINVGGEKVLPAEVESVLQAHPLVADCRVYPERNALLGQVVAAEIVWRGGETDPLAVKRALHAHAGESLPRHKLPAVVKLVAATSATRNMKKDRSVPAA
ncbi:MAG TPA: fatty acid--CoA ligase family protein [Opitutaceae bacterium]|nr:fatty acid--CoA ligase family protein [Opitutaceae bacterium]